ncbi:MAG: DUF373 family protein [Halobacteriota archaeon]|nr:DUF373 family protein [Halobacteriota archaeon]
MRVVICIDRDDDIGVKAGIKTPIIGRENNINAAVELASKDPEESDVNTIFGGIKAYDDLKSSGEEVEIVTISGDTNVGVKSDRRIAEEIDEVLSKIDATGAIVVTDGAEDEFILPIIQSRVKIDAMKRVVVKQSHNLEDTYYRIIRMINDPEFSRTFFIPIGLACIAIVVSLIAGHPGWSAILITGIIGLYMLYRGFRLDRVFDNFTDTLRESFYAGRITYTTYITAILLVIVGTVVGLADTWALRNPVHPGYLNFVMTFIATSVWWYVGASMLSVVGRIINTYLEDEKSWRQWAFPFFAFASGLVLWGGSKFVLSIDDTGPNESLIYLVFSISGAIVVSLIGIGVSSYAKSKMVTNGS